MGHSEAGSLQWCRQQRVEASKSVDVLCVLTRVETHVEITKVIGFSLS